MPQGPPPSPVHAVRLEARDVVQRESVTGSLRAAAAAVLAAREEGPVAEILVREGAVVRAGDALVRLDDRRLVARRAELVATHAEATATRIQRAAELEDARTDLAALEAASNGDAVSGRELRLARTRVATSDAAAEAAIQREAALLAQVELMDLRIDDATLRAPFDGTIVGRYVELGEWVQPGTDLVDLVSTGRLEVWLDVPERLLAHATTFPDRITVECDASADGVVAHQPRVVPRVDPRTRRFSVVYDVVSDGVAPLSPGMSASAWLPSGRPSSAVMVPKDALVYRPSGVSVVTVQGKDEGGTKLEGVAGLVPIRIAFEAEREVALAADSLAPGTVVVVEGNERLMPGTPVVASIDAASDGGDAR